MKLYACYVVLNESEYLEYSLRSLVDAVDEIIIIHGSTKFAPLCNDEGLSIDNTSKIIEEARQLYKLTNDLNVFPGKQDNTNNYYGRSLSDGRTHQVKDSIVEYVKLIEGEKNDISMDLDKLISNNNCRR